MRDERQPNEEGTPRADPSLAEAARMLGMTRAQVDALLALGLLEQRALGDHVRITIASIEAYRESERARSREAMGDLADLQNELGLTE